MGRTNLGAKELCDGSETSIHSHAGGGGGPTIKSGSVTTDGGGTVAVTFGSAFPDTNYSILLTPQDPSDAVFATYQNKATTGFTITSYEDKGQVKGSVTVDWLVVSYSNP